MDKKWRNKGLFLQKWEEAITLLHRKIELAKDLPIDGMILVTTTKHFEKGKVKFTTAMIVDGLNSSGIYGKFIASNYEHEILSPVPVEEIERSTPLRTINSVFEYERIDKWEILTKKQLPLLISYREKAPLFEKLLKNM